MKEENVCQNSHTAKKTEVQLNVGIGFPVSRICSGSSADLDPLQEVLKNKKFINFHR